MQLLQRSFTPKYLWLNSNCFHNNHIENAGTQDEQTTSLLTVKTGFKAIPALSPPTFSAAENVAIT